MPGISRFFGIVIHMYYNDHAPPHFHAEYGELEGVYAIETLELLQGRLPKRVNGLVVEWALDHRTDLHENWARAMRQSELMQIPPLE